MGEKLGSYGGEIGKLWGRNWEVMGEKLGSYGGEKSLDGFPQISI